VQVRLDKLRCVNCWGDEEKKAQKQGASEHVGHSLDVEAEKGVEMARGDPVQHNKGRDVDQDNQVKDENNDKVIVDDSSPAPLTRVAVKAVDACGVSPGAIRGREGLHPDRAGGASSHVRLPREQLFDEQSKFRDPDDPLYSALCGRLTNDGGWGECCEDLASAGFDACPKCERCLLAQEAEAPVVGECR